MTLLFRRPTDELVAEIGDDVLFEGDFTDDAGLASQPGKVSLHVAGPNVDKTWVYGVDQEIKQPTTAHYTCLWKVPGAGRFYWRMWGEDTDTAKVERSHVGTILVLDDPTLLVDTGIVTP